MESHHDGKPGELLAPLKKGKPPGDFFFGSSGNNGLCNHQVIMSFKIIRFGEALKISYLI